MKSAYRHLMAATLLAASSLAATAQTTIPPLAAPTAPATSARENHGGSDPARMEERMARRQAELKQKLQLSGAQESSWNSFVSAMKPSFATHVRPDRAALEKLDTPDRIDQMRALRSQRVAEMDRRGEATKAFYATLTADQKKMFDAETVMRGHRGHHDRGGHHAS